MKAKLLTLLTLALGCTLVAIGQNENESTENATPTSAEVTALEPTEILETISAEDVSEAGEVAAEVLPAEVPVDAAIEPEAPIEVPVETEPAPEVTIEAPIETEPEPEAPAEAAVIVGDQGLPMEAMEIMPLIIFEETPLPDVIKTLARQASINFQFDPRVTAPTTPEGQPQLQPMVSIRFENVSPYQALQAVLGNYGLQILFDSKTNIARVTIKDPAAPEPLITEVIQLKYSNTTNMVEVLKPTLSTRSQVIPDHRTRQLVILTTEAEMEEVFELVDELDQATRQVLIEAHLMETAKNPSTIKGIDWSPTLENQVLTFGNGFSRYQESTRSPGDPVSSTLPSGRPVTTTPRRSTTKLSETLLDPLSATSGLSFATASGFSPATAFLNADGLRAVLSFLNTDSDTEVIATPRTVTLDNEMAELHVTRAFPIFQQTPGSANTPATSQIIYTNLGTILRVTPRIASNNDISLKVQPEVSNIDGKDRQVINGEENAANIYAIRRIETQVVVPSGHTLVMGGLVSDSKTQGYTKVPILGDIPLIGLAFRKESKERSKSNLIVFVTPTVVESYDFQREESTFLRSKKAVETDVEEWSAWDSGKPHDWSKPVY